MALAHRGPSCFLLGTVLLGGVFPHRAGADEKPPALADPAKLEGKILNKVTFDDVRVLGLLGFSLINEAQAKKQWVPLAQLQLSSLAVKAFNTRDHETAFRYAIRFILLRRGTALTEATEVAGSFDVKLDRKIVGPDETLTATLRPVFTLGQPLSGTYVARLTVRTLDGRAVTPLPPVAIKEMTEFRVRVPVQALPEGRYAVHYELLTPAGTPLVTCGRAFIVHAGVRSRVVSAAAQLDVIKKRRSVLSPRQQAALDSAEYLVELFQRARMDYVAPVTRQAHAMTSHLWGVHLKRNDTELFDVEKDLKLAERLTAGLLRGEDPLATRTGDLHLAYRSTLDNTLQPYRLYVPSQYEPARKFPLIVALHGATGDENTYVDLYFAPGTEENLFKKLGEERGYLLVTPNGRGPFGGYTGDSEKDVLEVLDRVQKLYAVEPRQVFLTGHSMGAIGTWLIGFRHPQKFAALAPLASRPADVKSVPLAQAPDMPVTMYSGGKDTLATPQSMREFARLAQKELRRFQHVEYPDDDHFVIGVTSMRPIFDFFDARRKELSR